MRTSGRRHRQVKKKGGQGIYLEDVFVESMCDCEELEFEDFEVMLAAISKASQAKREAAPLVVAPRVRR